MSNEVKTKNEVQNQKYIEPFVTAPKIRVISSLKQKIFKILLIILYAAVVGISISYLKDFVDDNGGLYAKKSTLLFLSSSVILGVVMVIFGGLFIQFVSRARSTVSINIFIKHFINTLSALVVIILLKFDIFGKDPKVFIKLYIYAMCGVGVLNLLTSLIVGFIENKKFPLGVKTTLLLMPGFVAIIASIFLITLQYEK
ncbi:MAG: hypothetical protein KAG14_03985, partial [Mycoplasmataceae bacterium]|nr:hypothetical protein [Mycoplasmataceae bacterium]